MSENLQNENKISDEEITQQQRKEKITKCKYIAMDEMNHDLYTETYTLNKREKTKLIKKMLEIFKLDDEQIQIRFDEIALHILDNFEKVKVLNEIARIEPPLNKDISPMCENK